MKLEDTLVRGFATALGVDADEALRRYVREGQGELPGGARLLAWDANSIHAFVFDTTNATGIRGASDVLRSLDGRLAEGEGLGLEKEQILFAGGGSGLAVTVEPKVGAAVRQLHELFARETLVATATAAAVELAGGPGGFRESVDAASRALSRDRLLTGPDGEPSVPFFAARCAVCGRRAAAFIQRRGFPARERLECAPCHLRIQRGRENVRFQNEPSGFEDIADRRGKGFYAVLYMDGNGIGKALSTLESPLSYARFSRAIARVVAESFTEVAKTYGLVADDDSEREPKRAHQLPICGGDDLVAILPGEISVPFARDLLRSVELRAGEDEALAEARIRASAGVAIGKVGFPVRHLLAEAEAHLKIAKRRAYGEAEPTSCLSFAVVTDGSPRAESTEPERWARGPKELLLSGCPYTLEEFDRFSGRFCTFLAAGRELGRTQLYAVRRYAELGPAQLRNHVLYQVGRREAWQQLAVRLSGDGGEALRDPDVCFDGIVPHYGGRRVLDVADMVSLLSHWVEPEEAS